MMMKIICSIIIERLSLEMPRMVNNGGVLLQSFRVKAYYDIQVNIIIYEVIIKVCDLKLHIVFDMSYFIIIL